MYIRTKCIFYTEEYKQHKEWKRDQSRIENELRKDKLKRKFIVSECTFT